MPAARVNKENDESWFRKKGSLCSFYKGADCCAGFLFILSYPEAPLFPVAIPGVLVSPVGVAGAH